MKRRLRITTTSYAVLGLLAVEEGTAYQLTKRMLRNYKFVWPRAQSKLFEECKHLVDAGWASAHPGRTGRRPHVLYRITAAGRRALAGWVPTPSEPPSFSFEAALKVTYGDFADRRALLRQLAEVEAQARTLLGFGRAIAEECLTQPVTGRIHLQGLMWRFLWEHQRAIAEWAAWAQAEVRGWSGTRPSAQKKRRALAHMARSIGWRAPSRKRRP
jgi:PadR family transcriptional regulator, regulatory protein AphA